MSRSDSAFRLLVSGSRSIDDRKVVKWAIKNAPYKPDVIMTGAAEGVDQMAEDVAREMETPYASIPAKWSEHGDSAGPRRNQILVDRADALLAVWDGESPGTKDAMQKAAEASLPIMMVNAEEGTVRQMDPPYDR